MLDLESSRAGFSETISKKTPFHLGLRSSGRPSANFGNARGGEEGGGGAGGGGSSCSAPRKAKELGRGQGRRIGGNYQTRAAMTSGRARGLQLRGSLRPGVPARPTPGARRVLPRGPTAPLPLGLGIRKGGGKGGRQETQARRPSPAIACSGTSPRTPPPPPHLTRLHLGAHPEGLACGAPAPGSWTREAETPSVKAPRPQLRGGMPRGTPEGTHPPASGKVATGSKSSRGGGRRRSLSLGSFGPRCTLPGFRVVLSPAWLGRGAAGGRRHVQASRSSWCRRERPQPGLLACRVQCPVSALPAQRSGSRGACSWKLLPGLGRQQRPRHDSRARGRRLPPSLPLSSQQTVSESASPKDPARIVCDFL